MRIFAVDPGIGGTGWAVLERGGILVEYGVIHKDSKGEDWESKGFSIAWELKAAQKRLSANRAYVEFPSLFQSAHGQMVARRGDLVKLAWFTGLLSGSLVGVTLVPVNDWKGQLPKGVVANRIQKILGEKDCASIKSHAWDAVGIGLWAAGRF
jgi:hypothetical protein